MKAETNYALQRYLEEQKKEKQLKTLEGQASRIKELEKELSHTKFEFLHFQSVVQSLEFCIRILSFIAGLIISGIVTYFLAK